MKRNTLIAGIGLSVLLIALVFAAGCEDLGETACDAMPDNERDHCIQKLAATSGNITRCDDIKGAGPASKCYVLVAQSSNSVYACNMMNENSWYNHRDAYHREDCLLYIARNSHNFDACMQIEYQFYGQATDLNPYMDVTQENCLKSLQCGKPGQPACYTEQIYRGSQGEDMHYICGDVMYPKPVTCP
jgi:hypothetical protein